MAVNVLCKITLGRRSVYVKIPALNGDGDNVPPEQERPERVETVAIYP